MTLTIPHSRAEAPEEGVRGDRRDHAGLGTPAPSNPGSSRVGACPIRAP